MNTPSWTWTNPQAGRQLASLQPDSTGGCDAEAVGGGEGRCRPRLLLQDVILGKCAAKSSAIRQGAGWSGLGTQAGEWDEFSLAVAAARF